MKKALLTIFSWVPSGVATLLLLCLTTLALAQAPVKKYTVKDGRMVIELDKRLTLAQLDSFITQFDLQDLGLRQLFLHKQTDSLKLQGWRLEESPAHVFLLTKPMQGLSNLDNLVERILITDKNRSAPILFPAQNSNIRFGYNRFKNKAPFAVKDSLVLFYLRQQLSARNVKLAGSFNNWDPNTLAMVKTDSGWIARVKLVPGKYWYKFIIDGNWTIDQDNLIKENDGRGNTNSVYYNPNVRFSLPGFPKARRVYLAGSFNNWREKELLMQKTASGWELPLYLAKGTHTYKFIVDGNWHFDTQNPDRFPDEFGSMNSVIRIGTPYVFKLEGFKDAKEVILTGSFNNWREDELYMDRTPTGWEFAYTLGPGNYEYKFKVDRQWMTDPANPLTTARGKDNNNSILIIQPNHTFRLRGYKNAKAVYVAGDFYNWSPTALPMQREGNDWVYRVHLPIGKTRYKFIVDGEWIIDPHNKLWEQNEHMTGNSILWIEN